MLLSTRSCAVFNGSSKFGRKIVVKMLQNEGREWVKNYRDFREFLNENHTPYINHFIIVVKFFEIIYNFIIRRVQDNHGIFVNLGKRYLCGINIYITKTYSKAIQLFTFIPLNLELNFRMNSDSLSSLSNLSKL